MVSLIRPGDRVLVPVFGRFGHLLAEIAERALAEVHTIEVPWGQVFPVSVIREAIERVKPHLVACVQGDTSTTMLQPLEEIGEICRAHGALFYTDATASLGGNPFEMDAWGLDAATAGLQKCLGGPSGSAPISLSDVPSRWCARAPASRPASARRATPRHPTSSVRTTSISR